MKYYTSNSTGCCLVVSHWISFFIIQPWQWIEDVFFLRLKVGVEGAAKKKTWNALSPKGGVPECGYPQSSSIYTWGCSLYNHPAIGVPPIYGNPHLFIWERERERESMLTSQLSRSSEHATAVLYHAECGSWEVRLGSQDIVGDLRSNYVIMWFYMCMYTV